MQICCRKIYRMTQSNNNPALNFQNRMSRDQLITTEDLQNFKSELLEGLKAIISNNSAPAKKWLKSDEVKKLLKVSAGTLQTLRINGTLQYTKIGGIIYYDYEHIQKTFEENLRPANA